MQQLTQKLKNGELTIQEVPWPQAGPGMIVVRSHYSLISPGTEGATVKTAQMSLIGKAKERPQQVRQVVEGLRKQGPVQTYRAVMKRLDAYSPLGYSSAGEVIETGVAVCGFARGDKVACAGVGYANHAEIVSVPKNLCVKLLADADLRDACYNTLGAIALQGIRQADLRLGEACMVIGLGLLGQLTCVMLRAGGIRAYGVDIDDYVVELAREHCCDAAWNRSAPGISYQLEIATGGIGPDAVIITAATSTLDPVNFAGKIVRRKGRVVVVGAVPTGFERESYYRKELDLRMSCSYGPGRYDPQYEEQGHDYPAAYVRWTENRNMQAFQELLHRGKIDVDYLTTHEFLLEQAPQAYDMIVQRNEPFLGVVLKYDIAKPLVAGRTSIRPARPTEKLGVAFVGAGSYAQQHLLPNLPKTDKDVTCVGIMTSSGTTSKRAAEKYGFAFCTSEPKDIFQNDAVNTVFIATRHDSHACYVRQALAASKHVFVEKPLCLTPEELSEIEELYESTEQGSHLMIGFNRRFAPLAVEMKNLFDDVPICVMYRVNAGPIPRDSWIQDRETGGGRIVGEVCHFIDCLTWLCGAPPISVHAVALADASDPHDTVCINLEFGNGAVGTICYFANGSKQVPKEYVEVYGGGVTAILKDFRELEIHANGKPRRRKSLVQDKGQAHMVRAFLARLREGGSPLIRPDEIFSVMRATFAVNESIRSRQAITI
jgi:predicted dehydrogenase/threonine dehydrogenase-like Zn-dependent dehydrogenase